ncbi:MAG: CDP-glucose 4,6-dehydratase [Limisphaerales bacterium]
MSQSTGNSDSAVFAAYRGRRVLVTGHTGFKGSWLCEWLLALGAEVTGLALAPDTNPSLFEQLGLGRRMNSILGDIRNEGGVRRLVLETRPDRVFHLAAQPLVRRSYREPVLTWQTNVLGTIHLLEALRELTNPCVAVIVTTDKCYENREWVHGYREEDPLGGHDPYSSSKAGAEIAVAAWRRSYFKDSPVRLATARAGNVIGGGDWSEDRIFPDIIRALSRRQPVRVRNPRATRPWQHVLEPLGGYLTLAARLAVAPAGQGALASAFNFGPGHEANRTVRELVEEVLRHWPGQWQDASDPNAVHEAGLLQLSSDRAAALLGWSPVWGFAEAVRETVRWHHDAQDPDRVAALTRDQIAAYQARAARG